MSILIGIFQGGYLALIYLCHKKCFLNQQAFINYNFSYTKFCACETVLGARPCTWQIFNGKEQICTLLTITWYSSRNCNKLVLKPLATQNGLSISILCTSPFLYLMYFSLHDDYPPFVLNMWSIYRAVLPLLINWNEKCFSESNILTMDYELVLENSSSAVKYWNIRLRQTYLMNLKLKTRDAKDWGSNAVLWL